MRHDLDQLTFPMEDSIDEQRKYAILFAATILAARKLHEIGVS
jgi:hypothetical protein